MIKMVATAVGTMSAEMTDATAVRDDNNYYNLQYIHYFVIHTSITRNRNRKTIINHKSVLSLSTPADELSRAESPGTLERLIKLQLT